MCVCICFVYTIYVCERGRERKSIYTYIWVDGYIYKYMYKCVFQKRTCLMVKLDMRWTIFGSSHSS